MSNDFYLHIEDDSLELYALSRLPDEQYELFEEHLLICHACQNRLAESCRYVRAMREACRLTAAPTPVQTLWGPRIAWGLALAGAMAMTVAIPQFRGSSAAPEQEVTLRAMRGIGTVASPQARADRPLCLRLNITEFAAASAYLVDVADSTGRSVWQGHSVAVGDQIVQPIGSLSPGQYWVRVYGAGAKRPLLREFSLPVSH